MANVLASYDPLQYANEALTELEKALGMAFYVFRGYSKTPSQRGSTIDIRIPGSFTVGNMPISTAEDIEADNLQITLDQWKGVLFALTDKELNYTQDLIVREHFRPAGYAIADSIDQALAGLYTTIPHYVTAADPGAVTDFTSVREKMFDNKVPNAQRSLMINGEREADYLALSVFHQANTSSDGAMTQRDGYLGRKFGFDIFANQNVQTHTVGTLQASDDTGAVVGAHTKGASTLDVDGFGTTETLKAGDVLSIAGDGAYSVTADATMSSGAATLSISPDLRADVADNAVVTISDLSAKNDENLAFHRNTFALAMAPLSDLGQSASADIGVAEDPITNLTLRSRRWYEGKEAKVYWGLDVLYGVKTIRPDTGVRLRS